MLSAFVIKECEARGKLRSDHYLVTTLVSTQMARALATREGIRIEDDLLVGFKWIANRIDEAGPASFLFAFEESHGYLKGTHARDKDAAVAALLFAELAAAVKDRKQTVLEYLDDLYIDVGHHGDRLITKVLEGREGLAKIKLLMDALRGSPPREIGGMTLTEVFDYKAHEVRSLGHQEPPAPCPDPPPICSSSTRNAPVPDSRRGRQEPSPRSSSTSLCAPKWPGPTLSKPRRPKQPAVSTRWPAISNPISRTFWTRPRRTNSTHQRPCSSFR